MPGVVRGAGAVPGVVRGAGPVLGAEGDGRAPARSDGGEATIEFIGMVIAVLVPLIYVIVCLANVQSGVFAAEAASREVARVLAADPTAAGVARAQADLAFGDHGLPAPASVETSCEPTACRDAGSVITVTVRTSVPLPLVPGWIGQRGLVPVSSTSTALLEGVRLVD